MPKILAVIPAAWVPNNKIFPSYSTLPDCMIPINSKPVIGHIVDNLIQRGIWDIIIILRDTDKFTEKYIRSNYAKKVSLEIIYVDWNWGMVGSLIQGFWKSKVFGFDSVLIYSGDTIYRGNLSFDSSFVTVVSRFDDSSKWCIVESENSILYFVNKPDSYTWQWKAITWLYYFQDLSLLLSLMREQKIWEFYNIIDSYARTKDIILVESDGWYDMGNIDNYYQAKIDFLKTRHFNSLEYNDTYWTIKKSSSNNDKINCEINWYLNMPDELRIFAPRLVDYNISESSYYEIEYYWYGSLGDMFLFWHMSIDIWKSILGKLFDTVSLFKRHKAKRPRSYFVDVYKDKTLDRISQMKDDPFFEHLMWYDDIILNGERYDNIKNFIPLLDSYVDELYIEDDITFMHGDFFPWNLIYDPNNRILKMIDPRGSFGEVGIYGDNKYDIAKMRHSFVWHYDFIVSDLFTLAHDGANNFVLNIQLEDVQYSVSKVFDELLVDKWYDIHKICTIEALLFLSMIPLHSDYPERQKAMYLIAVQKFNLLKEYKN
jgi:dTDP-glucose pyrophosphorylase